MPTSFSLLNFRERRSAFGGKELYIKFACQVACFDKIYFSIAGTAWERKKMLDGNALLLETRITSVSPRMSQEGVLVTEEEKKLHDLDLDLD